MTSTFTIGQRVTNFGQVATVWDFYIMADGQETGTLILRDDFGMKWLADPSKCQPVNDGLSHKMGFVVM